MDVEASTREAMFATECIHENQAMLDRRMTAVLHDCRAAAPGQQPD
jgi:hypothetical protein